MTPSDSLPLAAVLLAQGDASDATVRAAVDAARDAGAQPVVLVLARGVEPPPEVRVARVAAGAPAISALRAGMALLTNTTARLALLWPVRAAGAPASHELGALVHAARDGGAAVTAYEGTDLDASPIVVARDAWLDVVTLGEQGLDAVAARRGLRSVTAASP